MIRSHLIDNSSLGLDLFPIILSQNTLFIASSRPTRLNPLSLLIWPSIVITSRGSHICVSMMTSHTLHIPSCSILLNKWIRIDTRIMKTAFRGFGMPIVLISAISARILLNLADFFPHHLVVFFLQPWKFQISISWRHVFRWYWLSPRRILGLEHAWAETAYSTCRCN